MTTAKKWYNIIQEINILAEIRTEIYEEVSAIEKRLEVLELTQRQILTAISELEK